MDISLHIEVKPKDIIEAVKKMKKKERDAFLEDLLAATSPKYLRSIEEARADYKMGRVKTPAEVLLELHGSWQDRREADQIIDEIKRARKSGNRLAAAHAFQALLGV